MLSFSRKNKKMGLVRGTLFPLLMIIILLAVVGFLAFSNIKMRDYRQRIISQLYQLEDEIRILEKRNEELKAKISQSSTQDFLEQVAREQFNLKASGEEVVVISKEGKNQETTEIQKQEIKKEPFFKQWWNWLKDKF